MESINTELAWSAGFFDGEGHSRTHHNQFSISITQKHRDVLERFQNAVGCGNIYGPYPRKDGRTCFEFKAQGLAAYHVFYLIQPYLCQVKYQQAVDALAKIQVIDPSEKSRRSWQTRKANGWQPIGHGHRSTYIAGCRCVECKAASAAYYQAHKRSKQVQAVNPPPLRRASES